MGFFKNACVICKKKNSERKIITSDTASNSREYICFSCLKKILAETE